MIARHCIRPVAVSKHTFWQFMRVLGILESKEGDTLAVKSSSWEISTPLGKLRSLLILPCAFCIFKNTLSHKLLDTTKETILPSVTMLKLFHLLNTFIQFHGQTSQNIWFLNQWHFTDQRDLDRLKNSN